MHSENAFRRIRIVFAAVAVCIGFFVVITFLNMRTAETESKNVQTTLQNLLHLENIINDMQAIESGQRGYIVTGEEKYLDIHEKGLADINSDIDIILSESINDAGNVNDRIGVKSLIDKKIKNSKEAVELRKSDGFGSAAAFVKTGEGEAIMMELRTKVTSLENIYRQRLKDSVLQSRQAARDTAWQFLLLAGFFYLFLYAGYRALINDLKKQQKSDKRLSYNAAVLNNISDAIITTDKEMRITHWNKFAEEIYGWKQEEVVGKSMKELLDTRYADSEYSKELDHFINEGSWKGEVIHTHKNGETLYVFASTAMIKDRNGNYSGGVVVVRDITDQKRIQEQLKLLTNDLQKQVTEKVSELNNVFERITDAVIALDNNWNYTYLNAKAASLHGKDPEELIGKNIWEVYPDVTNEDFYRALNKARDTMQPVEVELYYSKTGQWFKDHIYPSALGMSVYYHDITDKKNIQIKLEEAEVKFRSLVENSAVGVYIVRDDKFLYTNPYLNDLYGYTDDEIMKVVPIELVAENDRARITELNRKRLISSTDNFHYEFEALKKNGEHVHVEVYGNQIIYKGEKAVIGTLVNVHERKKAIKELERSERELIESNERFMLVAKATNDLVWDWNISDDTIQGNEAFLNQYGLNAGDRILFDDFKSRLHQADVKRITDNLSKALAEKTASLIEEFRFRMTDGSYRTLHDRSYILYDENGKATRMLGAMQDITNEKLSTQQLILEKELSDSIINSLPGIFYLYNKEGQFYRWNKNFEEVTGYSKEEIEKLHPVSLFPEDERKLLEEKISNVFKNGEDKVEAHFLTKAGDLIPYYFTGMLISYEGEVCLMGVGIDISDKVKSQQKLIESEEKFRMLIEQASDGIFISNQMGDYLVVNSSAAILTGYTKEELTGMNMADILFDEDLKPYPFRIKELLGGEVVINERLIRQKGGKFINAEISSKLLPDGRFQGIARDITARKSAEDELRYSEEKTRLIMNSSLDAIITLDTNGMITFWNKKAEMIFGWSESEIMGTRLSDSIIPHKFREMHDKGMANYVKTGIGFRVNNILELTALNRAGKEFPVELTVIPIRQNNELFFCAFIRDITLRIKTEEEIRISEHKYRLLFEQNPMPMWMISLPGKNFLAVNEAAVEYYGYSQEEFLTMNIKDLRQQDEIDGVSKLSTYKSGISNTGIWEHLKKDGTVVKVNLITHDIIFEGRHAKLVLANDMTEKIRAEEKLKNSHAELRQLATHLQKIRESERTHMAREIHDELGQQLTGLKMDISWINKKLVTEDKSLRQKMNETLKLIDGTVKTVRRLATQLRPSILDDLGIVAAMEWQSDEFEKRSEIETLFSCNVSNIELPTDIATGFFRIYQESLTNVSRHSKATKVESVLSIKDGLIILSISDNGVGFNAKAIENKKTLGLLGMKERTLIMGGSYEITSKPGKGTTVVIIVPIQQSQNNQ